MIGELSDEQLSQYESTFPENDGTQHTKAIVVDYTMEDEIKRGCIILKDYLNEKKKKYGIGKMINNNEYLQMSRNLYSNV